MFNLAGVGSGCRLVNTKTGQPAGKEFVAFVDCAGNLQTFICEVYPSGVTVIRLFSRRFFIAMLILDFL